MTEKRELTDHLYRCQYPDCRAPYEQNSAWHDTSKMRLGGHVHPWQPAATSEVPISPPEPPRCQFERCQVKGCPAPNNPNAMVHAFFPPSGHPFQPVALAQAEKCPCCGSDKKHQFVWDYSQQTGCSEENYHEFHQGWEETIPEIPEETLASSSATEAPAQPLTAEDAAKHLYLRVAEVVTASRAFEQSESEETGKLFIEVNLKKEEIASIIRKVTEPLEAENSRLKQELADERSADAATQAKVVQVDDENIRLKQELAAIRKEADAAENDLLRISKALNQPGSHVTSIADRTISELAVLCESRGKKI